MSVTGPMYVENCIVVTRPTLDHPHESWMIRSNTATLVLSRPATRGQGLTARRDSCRAKKFLGLSKAC